MPAATDRIEFAPPPPPGRATALALAVLAHVLLMLALTWGINWNREQDLSAEAELWSSVPQEAAPAAVPAPPVVQAPPLAPPPPPPPKPEPKVEPPAPPAPKPPDIRLEQEKRRQEEAKRREELEREKQLEARKRQQELEKQKQLEAQRKREELEAKRKQEQDKRAAAEKKRAEEQAKAKAKAAQEAKLRESVREQQLDRMRSLADGTGGPTARGTAARSSGPSASYAGRIAARIRPNIVFTDVISGNPAAEVHLRVAPDGTIVSSKLVKSSGVKSWDDAVLRAIDKTETIPRDVDGRVVPEFDIEFRPKD